jgi:hypothetical protein
MPILGFCLVADMSMIVTKGDVKHQETYLWLSQWTRKFKKKFKNIQNISKLNDISVCQLENLDELLTF